MTRKRSGLSMLLLLVFSLSGCFHEQPKEPGLVLATALTAPMEIPGDLAWDGSALWVADAAGEELYRVAVPSGKVEQKIPLPGSGLLPAGVAWDGSALWVAMLLDGRLYRLRPTDGKVLKEWPLPSLNPRSLGWDGSALWLLDGQKLYRIDPGDGRVRTELPAPLGDPVGLAWDGEKLWIVERNGGKLQAMDRQDGHMLASWKLPQPVTSPAGLAWDGQTLWLSDEVGGVLYQLRLPLRAGQEE